MLSSHVNSNSSNKNTKPMKYNRNTTSIETEGTRSAGDNNTSRDGASYLQTEAILGSDGRLIPHITYFNCGKKGHYSDNCPNATCQVINEEQHM